MKAKLLHISILMTLGLSFVILSSCKREPIELGVRVGNDIFSKEIFFSDPDIGDVTAIQNIGLDSLLSEILIVGELGSALVNSDGDVIQKTIFDRSGGLVVPVYNSKSQSFNYINKGGGWQPVTYIDSSGNTVLSISEPTPNDAALIDVNNDNEKDLVIGSNAGGGLVAFDLQGEQIWKKNTTNSFDVEIFEDEESKIVHTDGNEILVRSKSGELERTLTLPFESFEKGFWPGTGSEAIIGMARDSIMAFNLKGEKLGSYPIERVGRTAATAMLQDNANDKKFGAVVSLWASTRRSEFYIFNKENSVVFHEAIEAMYPVVTSLSTPDAGKLILIGGDNGTVWNYNSN